MNNLIIDIGNSYTKLYIYEHRDMVSCKRISVLKEEALFDICSRHKIDQCAFSQVGYCGIDISVWMKHRGIRCVCLTAFSSLPIQIRYKTPHTLGADRIAAAIGAVTLCPNKNVLVIDAGTCITYDFVDETACFQGGNISPGAELRFKALHQYTERLPLVHQTLSLDSSWGNCTEAAMQQGVLLGMQYEIESYIHIFLKTYPKGKIIYAGGNILQFNKEIKNKILFCPNLVAIGLNALL